MDGKYLIKDCVQNYYLVIPENADFYEKYAAEEFVFLYEKATGIRVLIERDNNRYICESMPQKNIISIGDTVLFRKSGVTLDKEKLGRDGLKVVVNGNLVLLNGGGGYGKLNAVYKFFEIFFHYKYYGEDEIVIDTDVIEKQLYDIEIVDVPDFKNRGNGFWYGKKPQVSARMRTLNDYSKMLDGNDIWGLFGHTHMKVLMPIEKYFYLHPDWYYDQYQEQLCLTNDEMRKEFSKNLIREIEKTPFSEYYMLGHVDSKTFCGCPECKRQTQEVGESGVMVRFINKVAKDVKSWQKENCPSRKICLGTFAYEITENPPTKQNEQGEYELLAPDLVLEDNVNIVLALINADYSKPINDERYNKEAVEIVNGWKKVTDRFTVWSYFANFSRGLAYFDGIDAIAENMRFFKTLNAEWVFTDTLLTKQAIAFQAMYCYVHAQLLWNTRLETWELIKDFIKHYYDDENDVMFSYLKYIYDSYKENKKEHIEEGNEYFKPQLVGFFKMIDYENEYKDGFWKYEQVLEMERLIKQALRDNENAEKSSSRKALIEERIQLEYMFVKYLKLELFDKEMGKENFLELLNSFMADIEKYGLKETRLVRCRPIPVTYTIWKNRAEGKIDQFSKRE